MSHLQLHLQTVQPQILGSQHSAILLTHSAQILTSAQAAIIQRVIALSLEETQNSSQTKNKGLPTHFRKCIGNMKMTKSKQNCSVCQYKFQEGQIIKQLPCRHIFHRECAKSWLKVNHKCPNCRMDLLAYFKQQEKQGKLDQLVGGQGRRNEQRCVSKGGVGDGEQIWMNKKGSRI